MYIANPSSLIVEPELSIYPEISIAQTLSNIDEVIPVNSNAYLQYTEVEADDAVICIGSLGCPGVTAVAPLPEITLPVLAIGIRSVYVILFSREYTSIGVDIFISLKLSIFSGNIKVE
jgi:hypothetical protein